MYGVLRCGGLYAVIQFRELASLYFAYSTKDINTAIDAGKFFEIEELVV